MRVQQSGKNGCTCGCFQSYQLQPVKGCQCNKGTACLHQLIRQMQFQDHIGRNHFPEHQARLISFKIFHRSNVIDIGPFDM